jgi:vacuolar-type H+-ATPase subunit E/Vma4
VALQDILDVIAADADQEAAAILTAARQAYDSRLETARQEAAALRDDILADAERAAQQERARRLHRSRLENQRLQVQVQDAAFLAAVRCAQQDLAACRGRPDYDQILDNLLNEALARFDEPAQVVVAPEDVHRVHSLLAARSGQPHAVEAQTGLAPGVVVRTRDGRIVTENTVESRLQRALVDLRPLLADLLSDARPAERPSHGGD